MYQDKIPSWIKHWDFEILDIICMEISFFTAYLIRHRGADILKNSIYLKMGLNLFIINILVVFFLQSYKGILARNKWKEIWATFRHVTSVQVLFLMYEYLIKEAEILSRAVFLMSWVFSLFLCYIVRVTCKKIVRKHVVLVRKKNQIMIISDVDNAEKCIGELYQKEWRDFDIVCVAIRESKVDKSTIEGIPVICGKEAVTEYVRQQVVDEVIVDRFENHQELTEWVDLFLNMGITVHVSMGFLPEHMPNKTVHKIGETYVITAAIKSVETWEVVLKRLMDILGGIVGLIITGIAYIFVAPAIKIASPGPVFFKQQRVGKNGRIFNIYKFRSMYMDAEERKKELMQYNEMQGLMFKMENDPRIIGSEKGAGKGLGNFIRKTSIDELPQFWNILKGDMSLVGTRPPTVSEYEQYELHHKIRLSQKPGLTGLWQVSGRSDITDFEEVVRLDADYIENWSLKFDIKILLKTIKVVLSKDGSR